jgi:hypothetical protein
VVDVNVSCVVSVAVVSIETGHRKGYAREIRCFPGSFWVGATGGASNCLVLAHVAWLFVIGVPRTLPRYPRVRLSCAEPS